MAKKKKIEIENELLELEVDKIKFADWNPNEMQEIVFNALVNAMKEKGLRRPILVSRLENGEYELVDGEHRLKACKELEYKKVLCQVIDGTEKSKLVSMQLNNIKGTMIPYKYALLLRDLLQFYTEEELASKLGMSISQLRDGIEASEIMQDDVAEKFNKSRKDGKKSSFFEFCIICNEEQYSKANELIEKAKQKFAITKSGKLLTVLCENFKNK